MEWLQLLLVLIAVFGLLVGGLSAVSPKHSIQLYQFIMKWLNWRVEPIGYDRELRNTRILGIAAAGLSVWLGAMLFRLNALGLVS